MCLCMCVREWERENKVVSFELELQSIWQASIQFPSIEIHSQNISRHEAVDNNMKKILRNWIEHWTTWLRNSSAILQNITRIVLKRDKYFYNEVFLNALFDEISKEDGRQQYNNLISKMGVNIRILGNEELFQQIKIIPLRMRNGSH